MICKQCFNKIKIERGIHYPYCNGVHQIQYLQARKREWQEAMLLKGLAYKKNYGNSRYTVWKNPTYIFEREDLGQNKPYFQSMMGMGHTLPLSI